MSNGATDFDIQSILFNFINISFKSLKYSITVGAINHYYGCWWLWPPAWILPWRRCECSVAPSSPPSSGVSMLGKTATIHFIFNMVLKLSDLRRCCFNNNYNFYVNIFAKESSRSDWGSNPRPTPSTKYQRSNPLCPQHKIPSLQIRHDGRLNNTRPLFARPSCLQDKIPSLRTRRWRHRSANYAK
jgi:hypothetical protein